MEEAHTVAALGVFSQWLDTAQWAQSISSSVNTAFCETHGHDRACHSHCAEESDREYNTPLYELDRALPAPYVS